MGDTAPSGKRRQTEQLIKDAVEEDDEPQGEHDPGDWKPATADSIKGRRKVHVKRAGQAPGAPALAPAEPSAADGKVEASGAQQQQQQQPAPAAAGANPFAGIVLTPPTGAAAPAATGGNPFAGISLVAPSSTTQAGEGDKGGAPTNGSSKADAAAPTDAKPKDDAAAAGVAEQAPTTTAPASAGGFGALAAGAGGGGGGSNPFASLGAKPFGGFGSTGGGFGALGAAAAAGGGGFGGFGAAGGGAGAGGAGGFGGGSTFSFGTGAFPPVAAAPLAGAASGGAAGGEGGEEEEGGEGGGDEGVALFGNAVVQPVVSLPEQEKRTGEEQEQSVFAADGTLYEFDTAANKWRERGKGEFKVNVTAAAAAAAAGDEQQPGGQQARMVMRQAANLRLLLNAKVYAGMPVALMPGNVGVTFGVVNAAAPAGGAPAGAQEASTNGGSKAGEDVKEAAPDASAAAADAAAGSKVKPTTWAVRMKSAEKVQALHDLLSGLRQAGGGAAAATGAGAV